jgi:cytochrome P450
MAAGTPLASDEMSVAGGKVVNDTSDGTPEVGAFSLFTGEHAESAFSLYARLRSAGPVVPLGPLMPGSDRRAWAVTRMEEAVQVLKDHARFTVDPRTTGVGGLFELAPVEPAEATGFFTQGGSMLTVDEPDHRRLRGLVSKVFTPAYVAGLRPRIQEIASELLDRVQDRGRMDVVEDYALPLPINVISEMLGVPRADRAQVRVWSGALAVALGRRDEGIVAHMRAFGEYTARLVAERRRRPADDLISELVAIEEAGDRLSEPELLAMITLLIFAGHETTSNLISTGTLVLLDHPDQLAGLAADPTLVPAAVEELLRYNGPATTVGPRFAREDVEFAGQRIGRGDLLVVALLSANHDETLFTLPDELDLARTLNRHVAFGHGIHVCLGAPLARLEGDVAFTTLLTRLPDLRLAIPREDVTWHAALNSRNLTALPVAFTARPRPQA